MSSFQEIHDRLEENARAWGEAMRKRSEEAGARLSEKIAKKDAELAQSAGMTLVEFQALIHEDGRIAATQEAIIMRHSIGLGHPCDIEAARKSFELLNPDTARKDTGV